MPRFATNFRNRRRATWLSAIVSSTLGLVLLAAIGGCSRREVSPDETPSVRIGFSRLRISLPLFVAQEKGYFQKHGVRVDLERYDTAQPLMQALIEDRLDLGGYTAMPISFAAMARSGDQLLFLTTMLEDQQHRVSYLLRRRPPTGQTSDIQSIADLKGKRIGILPTIAYRVWLDALLKQHGVAPEEVTIQQVEPALEPQLLASGGIDALFTNDPAATAAIVQGAGELITDEVEIPKMMGEPFAFASFNVRREWADEHADQLSRVSAALDEAIEFINAEPQQANELMRPYLPDVLQPHVGQYPPARYLSSDQSSEMTFQELADKYHAMGVLDQKLSLSGLVVHSKPAASP